MIPKRLNTQLILLVTCILLAVGVTSGGMTARRQAHAVLTIMRENAVLMTRSFAENAAHYLVLQDFAELEYFLLKSANLSDIVSIQVCEPDGAVVGHVEQGSERQPHALPRLERISPPSSLSPMTIVGDDALVIWEPIVAGSLLGWIQVTYSMATIRVVQGEAWINGLTFAVLEVACSIALLLIMLRPLVRAIGRLTVFARCLDEHKGTHIDTKFKTIEIAELGEALNFASARLFSTEQQLLHERERLHVTLRSIQDGVIATDAEGTVVFVNRSSEALTGWTAAEATGRAITEVLPLPPLPSQASDESYLTTCISSGAAVELSSEAILGMGKGNGQFIAGSLAPIRDDGGKLSGWVIVFRDITERKRVDSINAARLHLIQFAANHSLNELLEETLNKTEEITGSLIGFYHFYDSRQQVITLQAWSTRTKAEFCRAEGQDLHYPIQDAGVWADAVRQSKPVIHNDYAALTHGKRLPPGHAPITRELVIPVLRGGAVQAILGVGNKPTDYTEKDIESVAYFADFAWDVAVRKKAEEELKRLNERYTLAINAARLGVWDWDILKNELVWDEGMYALYGRQRVEFAGAYEAWIQGLHPEDRAASDKISELARIGEMEYDTEFRVVWPDGSIHFLKAYAQVVRDSAGKALRMTGINYEITKRKQAEEKIVALNAELEQRVAARTAELEEKNSELEHFNKLFVHRELRMVELKKRIQELENQVGQ